MGGDHIQQAMPRILAETRVEKNRPKALIIALIAGLGVPTAILLPRTVAVSAAPPPPPISHSRYVDDLSGNPAADFDILESDGCSDVKEVPTGAYEMTLDFKKQWYVNGVFAGTKDWSGTTRSVAEIENASQGYAVGWVACGASDRLLTLGIGTNNEVPNTGATAGGDWLKLVQATQSIPSQVAGAVTFVGASDIEAGFNTPAASLAWGQAYNDQSSGQMRYLDYGSADSCPTTVATGGAGAPCGQTGWNQQQVYMAAWGILAAYSLPEIYNTTGANAVQWHEISHWAQLNNGSYGVIRFDGVLTEQMACQQRAPDCTTPAHCCIDNTPAAGWQQLADACSTSQCLGPYMLSDQKWNL